MYTHILCSELGMLGFGVAFCELRLGLRFRLLAVINVPTTASHCLDDEFSFFFFGFFGDA